MDFTIRPTTRTEDLYSYNQSQQLSSQTGCIGHLCADMHTDQNTFLTTWFSRRTMFEDDAFRNEMYDVIKALRFDAKYDSALKHRHSLLKYCQAHPDARMNTAENDYGFRVDTKDHSYILRLNPDSKDHNLYCYCYEKDSLDRHMQEAEQGIRFIDSSYNEQFRLPDGGKIRITSPDGKQQDLTCRYIDPYHLEVGNSSFNLFHICEFAERMERSGNTIAPLDFMPGSEHEQQYQIYQLKPGPKARNLMFADMETAKKISGREIDFGAYELVYQDKLPQGVWLDDLYAKFNLDKPKDFYGHSLSVSDIIVIMKGGMEKAYYVDSIGFKQIPCPKGRDMQIRKELVEKERPSVRSALQGKKDFARKSIDKALDAAAGKRRQTVLE